MRWHAIVSAYVLLLVVPTFGAPPNLLRPPPCSVKVPKLPLDSGLPEAAPAPESPAEAPAPETPAAAPTPESGADGVASVAAASAPIETENMPIATDESTVKQTQVPGARDANLKVPDDSIAILVVDPNQAFGDPVMLTIRKQNYNRLVDLRNAFCEDGMRGVALLLRDGPPTNPSPSIETVEVTTTAFPLLEPESPPTTAPVLPVEDLPPTTVPPQLEDVEVPNPSNQPSVEPSENSETARSGSVRDPEIRSSGAENTEETMTVDSMPFSPLLMESRLFETYSHEGMTYYFLKKLV